MATTNCYKVHYHFEAGGKKISPDYIDYVAAAAGDYDSLNTVLQADGKQRGPGILKISAVQSVGTTGILT
jgi:hypothetical protein